MNDVGSRGKGSRRTGELVSMQDAEKAAIHVVRTAEKDVGFADRTRAFACREELRTKAVPAFWSASEFARARMREV